MEKNNISVVFDNGGGTTIIYNNGEYANHYDNPTQASRDYILLTANHSPADWDGNEPDAIIEYDCEAELSGGYKWLDADDIANADEDTQSWGYNTERFFEAIREEIKRESK